MYKFPVSSDQRNSQKLHKIYSKQETTDESMDEQHLANLVAKESYEDAFRVTLRLLASKSFDEAQKRFTGLIRQDPCDLELKLVYEIEILWKYEAPEVEGRAVSAIKWNPVNSSVLAAGYGSLKQKVRQLKHYIYYLKSNKSF